MLIVSYVPRGINPWTQAWYKFDFQDFALKSSWADYCSNWNGLFITGDIVNCRGAQLKQTNVTQ